MVPQIEKNLTREEHKLNRRYQNVKRKRINSKSGNEEEKVVKMLTTDPELAVLDTEAALQRITNGWVVLSIKISYYIYYNKN